jgi:succinate dehydrogenase / fumarate reductase cytochrome b subunit
VYKGQEGMWAWILHRVTGIGVAVFLLAHILDTYLLGFGPAVYDRVIGLYRTPAFAVMEVLLVGAVILHALNGIRVIIIDASTRSSSFQSKLFYVELAVFAVLFIPTAAIMLSRLL